MTTSPSNNNHQCPQRIVLKPVLFQSGFQSLPNRIVCVDGDIHGLEDLRAGARIKLPDGQRVRFDAGDISIQETLELWLSHPEYGPSTTTSAPDSQSARKEKP